VKFAWVVFFTRISTYMISDNYEESDFRQLEDSPLRPEEHQDDYND
jgi:hypothetical protein